MKRAAALLFCLVSSTGWAAGDIRVLSINAVEPGLAKVLEQYRRETGNRVRIVYGTQPQLERRLSLGDPPVDVLIAAPGLMSDQIRRNKVEAEGNSMLGRIGIGVAVRAGSFEPDIASLDRLKQSLLGADSIVFSQMGSGLHMEKLLDLLGIGEQLKTKTTRYVSTALVLEDIAGGKGIGFAPITEIKLFESKGVKLVGPLPAQVQSSTAYSAGVLTDAPDVETARDFVKYLATPSSKAMFLAAGIE
ncbi:MAG TPA: substrate-binding domain-containing protein [Burkholderiales bacterium]|nr:substrate-binding domain-containing protein [Burkholderiales bacterium]